MANFQLELTQEYEVHLENGTHLVPHLVKQHFDKIYRVIQEIAEQKKRKEQPFAADEFLDESCFSEYAESGFVFEYINNATQASEAYGFVTPSMINRLAKPIYADVRMCVLDENPTVNLLKHVQQSLVGLSQKIGYVACLSDTFISNLKTIEASTSNGFHTILTVPLSGVLAGVGICDAVVMMKRLYPSDEDLPLPDSEVFSHLPEYRERPQICRPATNIFPIATKLPDGTKLFVRKMEARHIPSVQTIFDQATSSGQGFGVAEAPSEELLHAVVDGEYPGHSCAIELEDGKTVAIMYVGPSPYCRSAKPVQADGYVLVDQRFGGRGTGAFLGRLYMRIAYELGYTGCLSDSFLCNIPVMKLIRILRYFVLGTLWKGGFLAGRGYSDVVCFYRETFKDDPQHCDISRI